MAHKHILEEAAEWFVDFRANDIDDGRRRAFNDWLRTSPEHIQAYLDVSAFWEDVPHLAGQKELDIAAIVAAARAEENVFTLNTPAVGANEPAAAAVRHPSRRTLLLAASAAFVFLCAGSLGLWLYAEKNPTHRTAVGEQKSMVLADGSTVELNSRSRIQVHFNKHERNIELLEGQALFRVARDSARPFIVSCGPNRVRAVGTQFDVYKKNSGTTVTVIEGRVAINETSVQLDAGQQVTLTSAAVPPPTPANIAAATAWTQRQLMFHSTSLSDVVEEFNRYNRRQLVVAGPGLDDFHISGVFSSTDPAPLIQFLRERFDVRIQESAEELRITR